MPIDKLKAAAESVPYEAPKTLETIRADEFLILAPPEQKCLLKNTLPAGITGMLVGPSGIGKSMFLTQMALSIGSGTSVCHGLFDVEQKGDVLMVCAEDDVNEIHRRIYRCTNSEGPPETSLLVSTLNDGVKLATGAKHLHVAPVASEDCNLFSDQGNTEFYKLVMQKALEIENLALIILDPLRRFFPGNEDSSESAAQLVPLLEKLTEATGATVLVVHHVSKSSKNYDPLSQDAARGSSALTDLCRWQLNIAPVKSRKDSGLPDDDGDYLEVRVSKSNYCPPQGHRLFLKRCDGGVLRYMPAASKQELKNSLIDEVVNLVKELHSQKKFLSQTELKTEFHTYIDSDASQQKVAEAANAAVQAGRLLLVPRPIKQKGAKPKDYVPAGFEHPLLIDSNVIDSSKFEGDQIY